MGFPPVSAYYVILVLSDDSEQHHYVLDYNQVMMVCDTLSARTFTLWYNDLLIEGSPGKLKDELLLENYHILDECLVEYGNIAYRSIGLYEALLLINITGSA